MPNFLCTECFWEDNDPRQLSAIPCPRCGAVAERLDLPTPEEGQKGDQVKKRQKSSEGSFSDSEDDFSEDLEALDEELDEDEDSFS